MLNRMPPWLSGTLKASAATVRPQCGELVFRTGQVVDSLHFLLSGEVHVARVGREGSATVVRRVGPGEFVSLSILSDEQHSCDARAVEASVVVQLPLLAFRVALREDDGLSAMLLAMIARALA